MAARERTRNRARHRRIHGSGFYLGVELIRNRQTLEPATEETTLLCDRLRELGIFMQPTGDDLNILKIKPPMVTSRQSVDFFVDMALLAGFGWAPF